MIAASALYRGLFLIVFVFIVLGMQWNKSFAAEPDEVQGTEIVSCNEGVLKVDAKEMRPEDLIKEIGEKCGIRVVVLGEAFSDALVSIKFSPMPIRKGVERVLRTMNVTNFVARFDHHDTLSGLAELYIVGKKGGEKQLTAGGRRPPPPAAVQLDQPMPPANPQERREEKKDIKQELTKEETGKIQENFLKIMDEILKSQEGGEEPDPGEILRLFKDAVPPEMRDQIPPEVIEELEKLESMSPPKNR
ncbi:MAG: hypothetical protein N3B18_02100 [Desulfobacterota bacterium]|nr:hypothetical protein [Thermodesulfobacteriota bacterium]